MAFGLDAIGRIVDTVGGIADDLITTKEEKLQLELEGRKLDIEERKIDQANAIGQLEVNKAEASNSSRLTKWRSGLGWICVAAFGYNFLIFHFLAWVWRLAQAMEWLPKGIEPPEQMETAGLFTLLSGMLGLGGIKAFEKSKGLRR